MARKTRLVGLVVCLASLPGPAGLLRAQQADAGLGRAMAAAVKPFVDRHELAGAVMLVADRDRVRAAQAVGWADVSARRPMQADDLFWIASQSKPITAAALMMLVDEGKVNLDDPVEKYLPEFKGQMVAAEKDVAHVLLRRPRHPITVTTVLSHTSGLPFRTLLEEPTLDLYPLSARVRSYAMAPLDFEPDGKYQYSNAGINTAGRIVEVVSGRPFEAFLEERLLRPLGMKDTTFWPDEKQTARLAKSYRPGPDNKGLQETPIDQLQVPLTDRARRAPMPAGGLFATAQDLARFYRMLLGGGVLDGQRVLSEAAVARMSGRQTPAALPASYGLGFAVDGKSFGHGGAYGTNTTADRERGLILVWLVQHAGFPGEGQKAQDAFRKSVLDSLKTPRP